jgi:hypothetical protein
MTANERKVIVGAVRMLRGSKHGSDRVRQLLADDQLRRWLDSWVLPALELVAGEMTLNTNRKGDLELAKKLVSA